MLILWHMWNIQPGSTRAFGAMETSRYCEGIDCFHISKCPARANFRFRHVIPVLIKYWYKFTENYFWRASFRALRLSCLLSGAFCRVFSHIFAFSVCNGPWIVPFGDAFWQTNILQSRICHRNHRNKIEEIVREWELQTKKKTEKKPKRRLYSVEVCICICTTAESSESSSRRCFVPKTFSSKSRLYASTPWFRNVRLFCKWYPSSDTNLGTVRYGNEFHQQRHSLFP